LNERFITLLDLSRAFAGDINHELDKVMRLLSSGAPDALAPAKAV